ncbi:MAG: serine hydrolase [Paraglaciecola sp.]|uniref:serine hydrolase n=1 Tax=Paraglaciecola sp. TaxID=1920173 RepID=UPI003297EDB6
MNSSLFLTILSADSYIIHDKQAGFSMTQTFKAITFFLIFSILGLLKAHANEQLSEPVDLTSLPAQVAQALDKFATPGMAVGVTYKGRAIHLEGYGKRDIKGDLAVTATTQFRIGSTSKAFTVASLGILVDEGKLNWEDKVTDHLPEFKMMDPWVTAEFTIRDLLTHKSGLVSGAGDSMIWPEPSGFSRQEVISKLRYLTPKYSFRSQYAYSNVMYITAAEIVARITNMPWEQFVDTRIFAPLNMNCYAGDMPKAALENVSKGYEINSNNDFFEIPRNGINGKTLMSAAAGGIVCNAQDMLKWAAYLLTLNKQLNLEEQEFETQVFSAQRLKEMWSPTTILPLPKRERENNQTHIKTYGLGWRLFDVDGLQLASHTGTISGFQAFVTLVPKLELGIVLLSNGSNSGARASIMQTILKAFVSPNDDYDWVQDEFEYREVRKQEYLANWQEPKGTNTVLLAPSNYVGTFEDKWFGKIIIENTNGKLRIHSDRMLSLTGTLKPFNEHSFKIIWDNQNAASHAFIHFNTDINSVVTSFTLTPFKVEEPENHEYLDMFFNKID